MRALISLLLLGSSISLGCFGGGVRPWERDVLARPDMAWEPDPVGGTLGRHIRFSKEAAMAGGAAGGGGCGCN